MPAHKWTFASRFRRHAFGWRSDLPIKRVHEAVSEIKKVKRKDPHLAAEGAVRFIEKVSAALELVDSSSGALGNAVNKALDELTLIIAAADVERHQREKWLDRLWKAMLADDMPYIETLGDHWGDLCADPEIASDWANRLAADAQIMTTDYGYFKGGSARLSALLAAGRNKDILGLLDQRDRTLWHDRKFGVQALIAMGRPSEALKYAEASRDGYVAGAIDAACEEILRSSGLREEAYRKYAIAAHTKGTYLSPFRALKKAYPEIPPKRILDDLVASTPGQQGKWFAAAKDAGEFDCAVRLVADYPTDPLTLVRAAEKHVVSHPEFALESAYAALRWMARGYGYEITNRDVMAAVMAAKAAAQAGEIDPSQVRSRVLEEVVKSSQMEEFITQWFDSALS
ncbi:MAG: hypothetical protein EVA65_13485 [Oceanococcus sp.]|nr:MAG: hypothetical protein EVA65_13485 [Oceanococcus sp.]